MNPAQIAGAQVPIQKRWSVRLLRRREAIWGYLFISPWIIGFLLFSLIPILAVFYFGFTTYNILQPPQWIGLRNYTDLAVDKLFWTSLYNTAYYVFLRLPAWLIIGLGLAMLLNRPLRGMNWFRTAFYLPTILPLVATSVVWMWLLHPQVGFINLTFRQFGIVLPNWLRDVTWAKPAIVALSIWQIGQTMMIFLAGLQEIPEQLYEAAEIDGAGWRDRFMNVTLPMMTPTIFFNAIMGIISAFQVFAPAFIMTAGGPLNSTLFLVLYLYRRAFDFLEMGVASAMAVVLFIVVLVFTALVVRSSDLWVHYERI